MKVAPTAATASAKAAFSERKPVARVDGVGAVLWTGVDDLLGDEVALARRRGSIATASSAIAHVYGAPRSASE